MPETLVDPPQQLRTSVSHSVNRRPCSSMCLTGNIFIENPQFWDAPRLNDAASSTSGSTTNDAPTSSPRGSRPTRWRRTTKQTASSEQPEPGADANCGGSGARRQARGPAPELQFRMPLCVIFGAPLRIRKNREGLIDVLELQSRTGRGVAIRMVAPRMHRKAAFTSTAPAEGSTSGAA
jgi:hypothetical protein